MPTYATSTVAAPMPNLENLRKQAKLILRWHRDRYYPVAAQIRALPRFSQMTDPDILGHSFRLSDAQELVARQHGFESWQALKTGLSTMPDHADTPPTTKVVITSVEPELFVTDIAASCDFFTGKLGFTIAFTYGDPPFYAQVMRNVARLNLKCVDQPVIDPALRDREELLSAALTVATAEEIKQLFLEFQTAGVIFFQTLRREPWGARNFIVKDPDGNLLLFAGPAE
jgi:catechol 2,3-dioxygenase-like lactoylglutathione lyase family enzyme